MSLVRLITLLAGILLVCDSPTEAEPWSLRINHDVSGKESIRFSSVIKQQIDTSCGLAVVASLLAFYWDGPNATEFELAEELVAANRADWLNGVSLADIVLLLEARGIIGRAFRVDRDDLATLFTAGYAPLIGHYAAPTNHFVLLLHYAINDDVIVIGDPSLGIQAMRVDDFESRFSGIVVALASRHASKTRRSMELAVKQTILRNRTLHTVANGVLAR